MMFKPFKERFKKSILF